DMDPFAFQDWIVELLQGKPNPRKTGDDGIDGWIDVPHGALISGDLIQVKRSDKVSKDVIRLHAINCQRKGRKSGIVVAFGFTRGVIKEADTIRAQLGINIELMTVKSLLIQTGKNIKSPGKQSCSKQGSLDI
ncbi:MAG: restriction endonuclease, partial [Candidatus Methanospirareceae archaeon]